LTGHHSVMLLVTNGRRRARASLNSVHWHNVVADVVMAIVDTPTCPGVSTRALREHSRTRMCFLVLSRLASLSTSPSPATGALSFTMAFQPHTWHTAHHHVPLLHTAWPTYPPSATLAPAKFPTPREKLTDLTGTQWDYDTFERDQARLQARLTYPGHHQAPLRLDSVLIMIGLTDEHLAILLQHDLGALVEAPIKSPLCNIRIHNPPPPLTPTHP
jgi:hypothetical protein